MTNEELARDACNQLGLSPRAYFTFLDAINRAQEPLETELAEARIAYKDVCVHEEFLASELTKAKAEIEKWKARAFATQEQRIGKLME